MKDYATLLAVGGAFLLGVGTIIYSAATKSALDSETIKMIATGLLGFAGGAGTAYAASSIKNSSISQ